MMPEDAVQATADLRARALLPAHVGKFSLARHSWDDPFIQLTRAMEQSPVPLLTPKIGEPVPLNAEERRFSQWWKESSATNE